jgi:ribosomal protein S18 acetylase RimI-like enzyme
VISGDRKVLEIRQADKCDIRDLVELDDECFETYYYEKTKFGESDFQTYLCRSRSILLVAVRDSCLVGYVAGTMHTSRFRSVAHLDSIAVPSTERNKGIGSRLLDLFIQEAKQRACQIVLLEVAKANKKGLDFFSHCGFKKITDLPEYYGRDLDGVLMELCV